MKLYVNEKLFSLSHKFYIWDGNNNIIYEISSEIISIGDKTIIMRYDGKKIAYIEQDLFYLTPHYKIFIYDKYVCDISRKFQIFDCDYLLDNGYRVDGDTFMLNFNIYDNQNNLIGNIQRQFISLGDKYEINVYDEAKLEIILSIIVAIANDINRRQRNNHKNK